MEPVAIVMAAALVQYFVLAYRVSLARLKYGVLAPATTGHPEFERTFRIHQNTLEQLIAFIPALWLFGVYVHALTAAIIGLFFPIGREVYRRSYQSDPSKRAFGAALGGAASMILLVGGTIGAVISWVTR